MFSRDICQNTTCILVDCPFGVEDLCVEALKLGVMYLDIW